MQPIRYENETAVFLRRDVDLFGMPNLFGYNNYFVISTYEDESPFVTDYKIECERRYSTRPIHRYNRVERFLVVLYQLLGERGDIPDEIITKICEVGYKKCPTKIWNSIRSTLKKFKWNRYYNRIPGIIELLGTSRERFNYEKIERIKLKFKRMSFNFDYLPKSSNEYFPNLRYFALRLLAEEGIVFHYVIPLIRTKRKEGRIAAMYNLLS